MQITDIFETTYCTKVEVSSLEDGVHLFRGVAKLCHDGSVMIQNTSEEAAPLIIFNKEIKLRVLKDNEETIILKGKVCGSNFKYLKIDEIEVLATQENRDFFRQRLNDGILATCWKVKLESSSVSNAKHDCRIMDISAGGVLLECDEYFAERDYLGLEIELVKGEPTFLIRCIIRRADAGGRYGCEFIGMTDKERDRLVGAIMMLQRAEILMRRMAWS